MNKINFQNNYKCIYCFLFIGSLPSILTNDCRNCDPRKMSNAQHMARYIEIRYPEIWSELVQKYRNKNIVEITNNGKK